MKLERLNDEAREICRAASYQDKCFFSENFKKNYLKFCKATGYKDISAENFLVYCKIYGKGNRWRTHQFTSLHDGNSRAYGFNRMMKSSECEKSFPELIEDHRVEMMRRMINANQ